MLSRKLPYIIIFLSIFTWASTYAQTTPPPPPGGAPPGFPIAGIFYAMLVALGYGVFKQFKNLKK
jgi:hypothetical protein